MPWKRIGLAVLLVAEVALLAVVAWSAHGGPTAGVAVRPGTASIVMSDQNNVIHEVAVEEVVAPVDGWLVAQADTGNGVPAAVLGSTWVPMGRSNNVKIQLDPKVPVPGHIFVTLLADKGAAHVLEYSGPSASGTKQPVAMASSPVTRVPIGGAVMADLPIIAGGHAVVAHVALSPLTFAVGPGQASLADATRTVDATSVVIPRVVAPAQSWVAVSLETTDGRVGQPIGATLVHSGEQTGVVVVLRVQPANSPLLATLHVDLGTLGQFEFSPLDPGNSPDQPYVAGGQTVSAQIHIAK
jgi:hypothetical protein